MLNAKRGILVFVLLLALLSVLSLALAQDEELVFGDLPRSETSSSLHRRRTMMFGTASITIKPEPTTTPPAMPT